MSGVNTGTSSILGVTRQTQQVDVYTTCGNRSQLTCDYNGGFGPDQTQGSAGNFGQTTAFDWVLSSSFNCPGTPFANSQCSRFAPATCPTLNGTDPGNRFFVNSPEVQCYYNLDNINNVDAITQYRDTFGETTEYNQFLVPHFCGSVATDCIPGLATCSNFNSADDRTRTICLNWASKADSELVDATKRAYCIDNGTEDCACLNRQSDEIYRSIKSLGLGVINDRCWYLPCRVATSLITTDIANQNCPANVCSNVVSIISQNGNVIYNPTITQNIDCTFNGTGPTPPPTQPTNPGDSNDIWYYIIGGLLILLLLIIIFYAIFF